MVSADTARSTAFAASLGVKRGSTGDGTLEAFAAVRGVSLITLGLGNMGWSLAFGAPTILPGAVALKAQVVFSIGLHAAVLDAKLGRTLAAFQAEARAHGIYIERRGGRPPLRDDGFTSISPIIAPLPLACSYCRAARA